MNLNLTREQRILLNLTARGLLGNPPTLVMPENELKEVNWEEIAKDSVYHAVSLIAFDSSEVYKEFINEEVYEKWKALSIKKLRQNQGVINAQEELINLLSQEKIQYVILKGSASSYYYPNPELRTFGDVDFLVSPSDLLRTEKILLNNGYKKSQGDHPNHVVFKKTGAHLEMHFEVAGIPYGEIGDKVREFLKGIVSRKKEEKNLLVPKEIDHALILLLHMQHHLLGEGLGLRHLSDWGAFILKNKDKEFWQELLPFLKEIGLFVFTKTITKTLSIYLNIDCPDWAKDAEEETIDMLIEDILDSGNFGRKDKNRSDSGMLVSEHGKGGTEKSGAYNLAHALHKAVLRQHPIVKKVWIFYPFIYSYKAIRFLLLSMIGKRPSLIKMLPEAKKRKNIYKKLQVFQTENEEK